MSKTERAELYEMMECVAAAHPKYRPSKFWVDLNRVHVSQLARYGINNFKRTVNTRYFNWRTLGILRHQFIGVLKWYGLHLNREIFKARFPDRLLIGVKEVGSFNRLAEWIYKTYVAMLYDYVSGNDPRQLMQKLEEPPIGNAFIIKYRGRSISQDLCNSVHEYYSIIGSDTTRNSLASRSSIAELGAGYGRLAYVFFEALPSVSYCIIDLPPALFISQWYLSKLYPEFPLFRFRPFTSFDDVRAEFEAARIRFLLPHQLELLPPKYFDYFINISSLHEMDIAQVENYFALIHRLCRGRMYTKQWRTSRAKVNGCVIREKDYPVPQSWEKLYQRRHPIQKMFFEALYQVPSH